MGRTKCGLLPGGVGIIYHGPRGEHYISEAMGDSRGLLNFANEIATYGSHEPDVSHAEQRPTHGISLWQIFSLVYDNV